MPSQVKTAHTIAAGGMINGHCHSIPMSYCELAATAPAVELGFRHPSQFRTFLFPQLHTFQQA
jgi:hypothetical protein